MADSNKKIQACLTPSLFETMRPGIHAWFGTEDLKDQRFSDKGIREIYEMQSKKNKTD